MVRKSAKAPRSRTAIDLINNTDSNLLAAAGTTDPDLQKHLLRQLIETIPNKDKMEYQQQKEMFNALLSLLKGFHPTNELEALLVIQIIAVHETGMQCLRRASSAEGNDLDMNLRHAMKLFRLSADQLRILEASREEEMILLKP